MLIEFFFLTLGKYRKGNPIKEYIILVNIYLFLCVFRFQVVIHAILFPIFLLIDTWIAFGFCLLNTAAVNSLEHVFWCIFLLTHI